MHLLGDLAVGLARGEVAQRVELCGREGEGRGYRVSPGSWLVR
jgi:hypothetical protein